MIDLEAAWRAAVARYPYLAQLPPFKTKWLYEAYEAVFERIRVRTILELGMYQGGSIALWREALGSRVIGVDLSPPPKTAELLERYVKDSRSESEVFTFWRTDQMDARALSDIVAQHVAGTLDIVIDDASHLYAPTRRSFEILFPLLRPGGVYVIEDWLAGKLPGFQSPEGPVARVVHELVDGLHKEWPIQSIEIRAACVSIFKNAAGPPVLRQLLPARSRVGESFNAQPSGASALAIACSDVSPESVVMFDKTLLVTTFGSAELLTAVVPQEMLSRPGDYEVSVRRHDGVESNALRFTVEAS